ncbi:MAG: HAD family hydrolase [Gammaproteobacteria bacterium]|nr:HAD family hydrolase [Gammaproteobacteria bacterium]
MKKIRGILFDKDGTLLDFNRTWLPPYRRAAEYLQGRFGISAGELLARGGFVAENETWLPDSPLASGSNREIFELWSEAVGAPLDGAERRELETCFARHEYAPVIENLDAVLASLRRRGFALGLATMDDEAGARAMLDALGAAAHFDFVCGADSGHGVKPEAGMALAFCGACGLQGAQIAVVGDSPKDLRMGENAGAALRVGVLSGAHDADALNSAGADLVLKNVGELEAALDARARA